MWNLYASHNPVSRMTAASRGVILAPISPPGSCLVKDGCYFNVACAKRYDEVLSAPASLMPSTRVARKSIILHSSTSDIASKEA